MLHRRLFVPVVLGMVSFAMPAAAQEAIVSPQVNADRTVTFRFKAPNAAKVEVSVEGSDAVAMTKGAGGVWSYTSKAMVPDIYGYGFSVDGVSTLDPNNPLIKPNLIWVGNMVRVPGSPPEAWETQNVPHGALHRHFYKSKLIGDERDLYVYTPPKYGTTRGKLPVLYLLHGFSDMAGGWTQVGMTNVIFDNLIAAGKMKPMVVVMPLGYGVPNFGNPDRGGPPVMSDFGKNMTGFRAGLIGEVMPMVEKEYRISAARSSRAIAGLSMGGSESLLTGLTNLDKFAYVGAFSSGGLGNNFGQQFPDLKAAEANKLKSLWISCGTEDGLIKFHRDFTGWLKTQGIQHTAVEMPGRHAWMVWRRNLVSFASSLFRD